MADPKESGGQSRHAAGRPPSLAKWKDVFLLELAATSNVSAAARKAGISTAAAYDARRNKPQFYREWQDALCEGYDHLEMELLRRLRTGELKPGKDARRGARTFDNATAFRLLLAHRENAARARAIREEEDADAILASIDAKIDKMRERAMKKASRTEDDGE